MIDAGLIAIMLAAFALAIGLVRLLDWLITKGSPVEDLADEPPDTAAAAAGLWGSITGSGLDEPPGWDHR